MNILFAPDYRAGVPYQTLLADALIRRGANVRFLQGYKRVFPLSRLLQDQDCDILHSTCSGLRDFRSIFAGPPRGPFS
jgi:hypothetical protein